MIGIDIADSKRFKALERNNYSQWGKVFSEDEWNYCFNKAAPELHLAGIFAAKEAVMKALGKSFVGRFDRISIIHDEDQRPRAQITSDTDISIEISISHDAGLAIAVAVIVS